MLDAPVGHSVCQGRNFLRPGSSVVEPIKQPSLGMPRHYSATVLLNRPDLSTGKTC